MLNIATEPYSDFPHHAPRRRPRRNTGLNAADTCAASAAAPCTSPQIIGAFGRVDFKERSMLRFDQCLERASRIGRLPTKSSSRTTRRSIGRSASPVPRGHSIRHVRGRIPCRRCRPSRRASLLELAANKLGLHAQAAPLAINFATARWSFRLYGDVVIATYYGCEFGAKASTLVTVIPESGCNGPV